MQIEWRVSYSDETVVTLRQELANLREELARLHKEDDLKKQNLEKVKEEIVNLRSTLKNQMSDMESIKEKLKIQGDKNSSVKRATFSKAGHEEW